MNGASPAPVLGLCDKDRREVEKILGALVPHLPVWAFGSRVQGKAKAYSDLDLAVITQEPLPLATMADLRAAFDESDLAFKVDLVDWALTSEHFRKLSKTAKSCCRRERQQHNSPPGRWYLLCSRK